MIEARGRIPADGAFRVALGEPPARLDAIHGRPFAETYARYFLLPRPPKPDGQSILCLACDRAEIPAADAVWEGAGGLFRSCGPSNDPPASAARRPERRLRADEALISSTRYAACRASKDVPARRSRLPPRCRRLRRPLDAAAGRRRRAQRLGIVLTLYRPAARRRRCRARAPAARSPGCGRRARVDAHPSRHRGWRRARRSPARGTFPRRRGCRACRPSTPGRSGCRRRRPSTSSAGSTSRCSRPRPGRPTRRSCRSSTRPPFTPWGAWTSSPSTSSSGSCSSAVSPRLPAVCAGGSPPGSSGRRSLVVLVAPRFGERLLTPQADMLVDVLFVARHGASRTVARGRPWLAARRRRRAPRGRDADQARGSPVRRHRPGSRLRGLVAVADGARGRPLGAVALVVRRGGGSLAAVVPRARRERAKRRRTLGLGASVRPGAGRAPPLTRGARRHLALVARPVAAPPRPGDRRRLGRPAPRGVLHRCSSESCTSAARGSRTRTPIFRSRQTRRSTRSFGTPARS